MLKRSVLISLFASSGLVLPACKGDGQGSESPSTNTVEEAQETPPASKDGSASNQKKDESGGTMTEKEKVSLRSARQDFAFKLYSALVQGQGENFVFSPESLFVALSMVASATAESTQSELLALLSTTLTSEQLDEGNRFFASQDKSNAEKPSVRFKSANRLWGEKTMSILEAFQARSKANYGATLESMDFRGAPEAARLEINRWISEQTEKKIPELLPKGSIQSDSRLVLTNAVYFNGKWMNPFLATSTKKATFLSNAGAGENEQATVDLMHQTDRFAYAENKDGQFLEMAYQGGDYSMLLFLPAKGNALGTWESRLRASDLDSAISKLEDRRVEVFLPKFEFRTPTSLRSQLNQLGMKSAFIPGQADFSPVTGDKSLVLSEVFHEAFIAVDEESTEAAGATGAVIRVTSAPLPGAEVPVFRADRPFFFMILDRRSQSPLFMGRFTKP